MASKKHMTPADEAGEKKERPSSAVPTAGRVVLYTELDGAKHPAIVVAGRESVERYKDEGGKRQPLTDAEGKKLPPKPPRADLLVFSLAGARPVPGVEHHPEGKPGTWAWPPRS